MKDQETLFNGGFIALNILVMFAFCNLAVFFDFYTYLNALNINKEWNGFIIGSLSISALIYRPFISLILTPRNGVKGVALGLGLTALCLILYSFVDTLIPLVILRLLHGLGYVIFVSSGVVLLMVVMPESRSGQGFGIISISPLLPFAVLPFIIETFLSNVPQTYIYASTAVLILPGFLLLPMIAARVKKVETDSGSAAQKKLPKGSLAHNITKKDVLLLLIINGLLYSVYALIFFFLKTFSGTIEGANTGVFFLLSTLAVILTRILLGPLFDKYNKGYLGVFSLLAFALSIFFLTQADSTTAFYLSACLYGCSFGIATPVLNSTMFTVSEPAFRGLNTNLMMETVDLGYVMGPTLAGLALAVNFSKNIILLMCIAIVFTAAVLMLNFIGKKRPHEE